MMDMSDKTDKTARLIKWQRITIGLLLAVALMTAFNAHESRRHEDFWRKETQYSDADIGDLERRHQADDTIIRDLDQRLGKYEHKYGEIAPARKGEGVYLNGPQSKEW